MNTRQISIPALKTMAVGALAVSLALTAFALLYLRGGWPHAVTGAATLTEDGLIVIDGKRLALVGLEPRTISQAHLRQEIPATVLTCSWRRDPRRAECRYDGGDVNERLLAQGVAAFSGDAVNSDRFNAYLRAEFSARSYGLGIWSAERGVALNGAADINP